MHSLAYLLHKTSCRKNTTFNLSLYCQIFAFENYNWVQYNTVSVWCFLFVTRCLQHLQDFHTLQCRRPSVYTLTHTWQALKVIYKIGDKTSTIFRILVMFLHFESIRDVRKSYCYFRFITLIGQMYIVGLLFKLNANSKPTFLRAIVILDSQFIRNLLQDSCKASWPTKATEGLPEVVSYMYNFVGCTIHVDGIRILTPPSGLSSSMLLRKVQASRPTCSCWCSRYLFLRPVRNK